MVPQNLNFWSISRKESFASQQKHALEIGFCEHYCVQMTISIPGTIEKCSLEREHPFLTEFVSTMNSCFIQYNAAFVEYVNLAHEIDSFCQK